MVLNNIKNKILILLFMIMCSAVFSIEYFKGYSSKKGEQYSVASLLMTKYEEDSRWNENYFHEAQFRDQGITIFTNIVFSNTFMKGKGCKFNCMINFKNGEKYTFNRDFGSDELIIKKDGFNINVGNNYIRLIDQNNYILFFKDKDNDVELKLNYNIVNPPQIFGDGIVTIDNKTFLSYSQPIVGAYVTGTLLYKNRKISLNGRGSVDHDYGVGSPLKVPRKFRSFWFYNDKYSIVIHTIIFPDNKQIDRVSICKDGKIFKSFLNTGLLTANLVKDCTNNFNYPQKFYISYNDKDGDMIYSNIKLNSVTDKIQPFAELSPALHTIVVKAVGEMWIYRFWAEAEFIIVVDNSKEIIKIKGMGNYIDMQKD